MRTAAVKLIWSLLICYVCEYEQHQTCGSLWPLETFECSALFHRRAVWDSRVFVTYRVNSLRCVHFVHVLTIMLFLIEGPCIVLILPNQLCALNSTTYSIGSAPISEYRIYIIIVVHARDAAVMGHYTNHCFSTHRKITWNTIKNFIHFTFLSSDICIHHGGITKNFTQLMNTVVCIVWHAFHI